MEIIEVNICKDYTNLSVSIGHKLSVSAFKGYLKAKSSWMILNGHINLKY